MVKWNFWGYVLILSMVAVSSSNLQTGIGMKIDQRPKRPTELIDDRHMVTIDLSALRPSLPGLVLYKYGEAAPKLVQVDLSALNPQLQPHIIWPQFDSMELLNDRSFDFDTLDAIPYLTDEESLITPKHQRAERMAAALKVDDSWPNVKDYADSDIYDFIPNSRRNDELISLKESLPLSEEVIVPLDWEEEKVNRNSAKRNVFMSRGWQAGGQKENGSTNEKYTTNTKMVKGPRDSYNVHYTPFGTTNWIPGKRKHMRETESEEMKEEVPLNTNQVGKKNVFVSSGWGPGGQQASIAGVRRQGNARRIDNKKELRPARISSQESWSIPGQYWNVPHLFAGRWQ